MNKQLYSQIKTELKEYPELKQLFKMELIYGQIAFSICNNVSISVIPEFINALLQSQMNVNILGLITLQKIYDLPDISARILTKNNCIYRRTRRRIVWHFFFIGIYNKRIPKKNNELAFSKTSRYCIWSLSLHYRLQ